MRIIVAWYMDELSFPTETPPQVIGSAAAESGFRFPGDTDLFQRVEVGQKKGGKFVNVIRSGFRKIARRIKEDSSLLLFEWKMGDRDWSIPEIMKLTMAGWREVLKEPHPIRVEVLKKEEGGLRIISNTFHLVYGNQVPVTGLPATLDTAESLLEGARQKMAKGDAWKALKRYHKYLMVTGARAKTQEQLIDLFNSESGQWSQLLGVVQAFLKLGKLTARKKRFIKDELRRWISVVHTHPGGTAIIKKLESAVSRLSHPALERIEKYVGEQLNKVARREMKRMRIKL